MKTETLLQSTVKVFLRLVGYHIMCLVVALSVLAICPGVSGAYIAQGFNLGIILVLPYMFAWQMGNDDINRVKNGFASEDRHKGFKCGFLAYIPAFITGVALLLAKFGVVTEKVLAYYRLIESPFLPLNQAIMSTVYTLAEIKIGYVLLSLSVLVLPPLSVGLGYLFGYEDISFVDTYFPKKNKR